MHTRSSGGSRVLVVRCPVDMSTRGIDRGRAGGVYDRVDIANESCVDGCVLKRDAH